MIRVLRATGSIALWIAAIFGVLCGLIWGATQLGVIKPLVVISGSMEPGIMTGDLVVDRPHATSNASVGEVASIHSTVTGKLVTHRIVSIERTGDEQWSIQMKGDANDAVDSEVYVVGTKLWQPVMQVAGVGPIIAKASQRSFTIPLAVTLAALIALTFLPLSDDEDSLDEDSDSRAVSSEP